jgi:phosphinothricin acetyltransferase
VYPWVVAIEAGPSGGNGVLGFARASRWKTRGAYDWACETGVYVGEAARGRGIATALCRALFTELERRGFRCVIAGVAQPNPASDRLHRSMGMTEAGTLPGVGFKHGRWIDVRYYTLRLGDGGPPGPPPGLG